MKQNKTQQKQNTYLTNDFFKLYRIKEKRNKHYLFFRFEAQSIIHSLQ